MLLRLFLCFLCILAVLAKERTPVYYTEKTLVKLVKLEHTVQLQEQEQRKWTNKMERKQATLEGWELTMLETKETAEKKKAEIERNATEMATAWDTGFQEKLASYKSNVQSFLENNKTPTVMFKAKLVSSKDITAGEVLVFTEVISNFGDGYNVTTGYFTAPAPGTYMFTSQICATSAAGAHVYMVANDTIVESTSHVGKDVYGQCITLTGVSVLDEGETACVRGSYSKTNALVENAYRWNDFSGVLIKTVYFF